jgi:hypothetical protein
MSSIKSADNTANIYAYQNKKQTAKAATETDDKIDAENKEAKNIVKKTSKSADSGVYTKKTAGKPGISLEINSLRRRNAEQLIQMVWDLLGRQGRQGYMARANFEEEIFALKDYLENGGTISAEEQAAAAAAIAEDGPWGVEAVSDRLVEAALLISGGDESKYKMMKSAIEAGFKAAEAMWGGQLPEISYKTFEATMAKLETAFNQVKTETA